MMIQEEHIKDVRRSILRPSKTKKQASMEWMGVN